jgi:hypothetical protein
LQPCLEKDKRDQTGKKQRIAKQIDGIARSSPCFKEFAWCFSDIKRQTHGPLSDHRDNFTRSSGHAARARLIYPTWATENEKQKKGGTDRAATSTTTFRRKAQDPGPRGIPKTSWSFGGHGERKRSTSSRQASRLVGQPSAAGIIESDTEHKGDGRTVDLTIRGNKVSLQSKLPISNRVCMREQPCKEQLAIRQTQQSLSFAMPAKTRRRISTDVQQQVVHQTQESFYLIRGPATSPALSRALHQATDARLRSGTWALSALCTHYQ